MAKTKIAEVIVKLSADTVAAMDKIRRVERRLDRLGPRLILVMVSMFAWGFAAAVLVVWWVQ